LLLDRFSCYNMGVNYGRKRINKNHKEIVKGSIQRCRFAYKDETRQEKIFKKNKTQREYKMIKYINAHKINTRDIEEIQQHEKFKNFAKNIIIFILLILSLDYVRVADSLRGSFMGLFFAFIFTLYFVGKFIKNG
jgi:hypothetical protein